MGTGSKLATVECRETNDDRLVKISQVFQNSGYTGLGLSFSNYTQAPIRLRSTVVDFSRSRELVHLLGVAWRTSWAA
jgi:hypothetical protein